MCGGEGVRSISVVTLVARCLEAIVDCNRTIYYRIGKLLI